MYLTLIVVLTYNNRKISPIAILPTYMTRPKKKLIYNVTFLFTDNSLDPLFLNTIKKKHMVYQIGDAIMIMTTIEKVHSIIVANSIQN